MSYSQKNVATVKKTSTLSSVVWLVPLIAVIISVWLLIKHMQSTGPEIILHVNNADGIKVNNTVVKFLDVTVGRVTNISLDDNKTAVKLTAQLNSDVSQLIRKDTQFWIVKPRIGETGVSGLNTLVSGSYIAFKPGTSKESATEFTISEFPPVDAGGEAGLRIKLIGKNDRLIGQGSPVLFGNIPIGQVEASTFNPNNQSITYQIYISKPNDSLIDENTQFWLQSGLKVSLTGGAVKVDAPPIPALISGAIAINSPTQGKANKVKNGTEFHLYSNKGEIEKLSSSKDLNYVIFFNHSIRGLSIGSPVEFKGIQIGSVAEIPYFEHNDSHKLFSNGWIPIRIRINPEKMELNADHQQKTIWKQYLDNAIQKGLTASLASDNLITGSLYIDLSENASNDVFKPRKTYHGDMVIASQSGGLDSIQGQIVNLLDKLNQLPLQDTVSELNNNLKQLHLLLSNQSTQDLPQNLNQTLDTLNQTLNNLAPNSPLYQDIQETLNQVNRTLEDVRPTLKRLQYSPNSLIFKSSEHDPIPQGVQK